MRQDPETHTLSVYDGTTLLGHIVDEPDGRGRKCAATAGSDQRPLGTFATRKEAFAAVCAAQLRGPASWEAGMTSNIPTIPQEKRLSRIAERRSIQRIGGAQ